VVVPEPTKSPALSASPSPGRKLWKAGELARRTGLTRQALHQYVLLGLLAPVDTTQGGQRLFDEEAAERVKLIRNLCDSGYTLKSIREIFFKKS
jgi:DNA-binding transcriptional MerR regulator